LENEVLQINGGRDASSRGRAVSANEGVRRTPGCVDCCAASARESLSGETGVRVDLSDPTVSLA
jgi:hypothetical protein